MSRYKSYEHLYGKQINYFKIMPKVRRGFKDGRPRLVCKCICGKIYLVHVHKVISGHTKSCGCMTRGKRKHWKTNTREFNIWHAMHLRCYNKNAKAYKFYGARGIKICERWKDFINFFEDMGKAPKGYSIERKNPYGDYEPSNCKWIPLDQQPYNRRNIKKITYRGKIWTLKELSIEMGIKVPALRRRLYVYKWSLDKALRELP